MIPKSACGITGEVIESIFGNFKGKVFNETELCKQNYVIKNDKRVMKFMSEVIAIIIFLGVILAIMTEKIHRTRYALTGTVLPPLTHVLTVDKAVGYIDFNTIGVLIGMMIFVAVVKKIRAFSSILQLRRRNWLTAIRGGL